MQGNSQICSANRSVSEMRWQGPAQSGREGMGAASKAASGSAVPCTGTPGVGCGAWGEVLAGNRNMASHSQVSTNFELKTG